MSETVFDRIQKAREENERRIKQYVDKRLVNTGRIEFSSSISDFETPAQEINLR